MPAADFGIGERFGSPTQLLSGTSQSCSLFSLSLDTRYTPSAQVHARVLPSRNEPGFCSSCSPSAPFVPSDRWLFCIASLASLRPASLRLAPPRLASHRANRLTIGHARACLATLFTRYPRELARADIGSMDVSLNNSRGGGSGRRPS